MTSEAKNKIDTSRVLRPLNINFLGHMEGIKPINTNSGIPADNNNGVEVKKRNIRKQKSMLDIIDETTLTSLPLIPPLKANNDRFKQIKVFQNKDVNTTTEMDQLGDLTFSEREDSFAFENDTFDDQIVLIEDYIEDDCESNTHKRKLLEKKQSLADFKKKLFNPTDFNLNETDSIKSIYEPNISLNNNRRTGSTDSGSSRLLHQKQEDLEVVLGKLPGTDLLKYCNLCEKPLYELSSLLNRNLTLKLFEKNETCNEKHLENKEPREIYNEFVCGECVELYEGFFDELYFNDLKQKDDTTESTELKHNTDVREDFKTKLISIFGEVQQKYDCQQDGNHNYSMEKHIGKKPSFSEALLNNLRALSEDQNFLTKSPLDLTWLREFQHKLRWRWRINGLIPQNSKLQS